jgi:hypothetical protein
MLMVAVPVWVFVLIAVVVCAVIAVKLFGSSAT